MCDWPALDKWAYVGVVNSVGFVRQSSGMKDVSVQWVLVNSMGLASLVGLHCTDEGQQPETSKWMSAVCPDMEYSFAYWQLISNLWFISTLILYLKLRGLVGQASGRSETSGHTRFHKQ